MEDLTFTDLCFLGAIRDYQKLNVRPPGTSELFWHTRPAESFINVWLRQHKVSRWLQVPITGNHMRDESLERLQEHGYIHTIKNESHSISRKGLKLLDGLGKNPNLWAEKIR